MATDGASSMDAAKVDQVTPPSDAANASALAVDLGTSANYVILAKSEVSTVPPS